jgi:hypothetical protein
MIRCHFTKKKIATDDHTISIYQSATAADRTAKGDMDEITFNVQNNIIHMKVAGWLLVGSTCIVQKIK